MKEVLSELQVLQLTASHLQLIDFMLQLLEQLLRPPLSVFLPPPELLHEAGPVSFDGGDQHAADLRAALYLSLRDVLSKQTVEHEIYWKTNQPER